MTQDSTENPRVLTWGRGQYGQLGHNSQPADEVLAPTAVPCLEGRPVARLACGQFHTAAVVAGPKGSGGVLTWGRGTLGVLGHGDEEDRLEPQAVELLTGVDVRSVACGAYQTAAVTRAGELFCWGWQFEDGPSGSGAWRRFDADGAAQAESARGGQFCFGRGSGTYFVDTGAMTQTNVETSVSRRIRRRLA